ncbi:MAG: HAMP domain-containing protein, partial [Planctomycetota bacterium]
MDRLSVRLAAGITILVVGLLAVGLSALSAHHSSRMIEERQRAAELQNRLLEVMLRHQMLNKDKELIAKSLTEIGTQPDVRRAMIVDHDGVVHFSSDPRRVGEAIPRDSETCVVCHRKDPVQRDRWVLLSSAEGTTLRSVLPIENRPECHECHDPEKKMNGMLLLDVSMDAVEAGLRQDRMWMLIGTALLALLLLLSIGLFVRRLILVRLGRLDRAARSIAAGNLGERVQVGGGDSIARLGADFNQMADAVSNLVAEVK